MRYSLYVCKEWQSTFCLRAIELSNQLCFQASIKCISLAKLNEIKNDTLVGNQSYLL